MIPPARGSRRRGASSLLQPLSLSQSESIRHPGHIIRHGPGLSIQLDPRADVLRQQARGGPIGCKQVADCFRSEIAGLGDPRVLVEFLVEEALELQPGFIELRREPDDAIRCAPDLSDRSDRRRLDPRRGVLEEFGHEPIHECANRLGPEHARGCGTEFVEHPLVGLVPEPHALQIGLIQQAGPQPVVQIVNRVRDLVREVGHLGFEAGLGIDIGNRNRVRPIAAVLQDALAGLVAEVQATKSRIALFQQIDDPQALAVVVESPVVAHQLRQHALARVTEWRVAEIVGEDHGFRQFFVEPQRTRDRSRNLRTLQGVGQAVSIVIAFVIDKDLGLVLQSTKRRRVNDAVAVALIGGPVSGLGLFDDAPARLGALGRVRREALAFFGFESLAVAKRTHASVFPLGFGLFENALELCARSGVDFRTGRLRGYGRR